MCRPTRAWAPDLGEPSCESRPGDGAPRIARVTTDQLSSVVKPVALQPWAKPGKGSWVPNPSTYPNSAVGLCELYGLSSADAATCTLWGDWVYPDEPAPTFRPFCRPTRMAGYTTGTLVRPNIAITSGHLLMDRHGTWMPGISSHWGYSIMFRPGCFMNSIAGNPAWNNPGNWSRPWGWYRTEWVTVSPGWVNNQSPSSDWALLALEQPPSSTGNFTRHYGYKYVSSLLWDDIHWVGYPDDRNDEFKQSPTPKFGRQWREAAGVWAAHDWYFRHRCHSWNGASGAVLAVNSNLGPYATGVNKGNYTSPEDKSYSYGVRINPTRVKTINDFATAWPAF